MLTTNPDEISRAAHRILICYGAHAVDIARERAEKSGHPTDIRDQDIAFLVLSEVEKLTCKGTARPS